MDRDIPWWDSGLILSTCQAASALQFLWLQWNAAALSKALKESISFRFYKETKKRTHKL